MEIDCIFVELISLFAEIDLINLVFVNKKLNICIMKIFTSKLRLRHDDCVLMGDTIDLTTFCYKYMKLLSYHDRNQFLGYDYCKDCRSFSRVKNDSTCMYGCTLICCGQKNISLVSNKKLACNCYITSRVNDKCKCGNKITSSITKCSNCNKIPLKVLNYHDKMLKYKNMYKELRGGVNTNFYDGTEYKYEELKKENIEFTDNF